MWSRSSAFHLGLLLMLYTAASSGADLLREATLRDTLQGQVAAQHQVDLTAKGQPFLAIHRPTKTPKTRGAVILLPGRAAHPASRNIIQPLATGLTAHGWETLAIQLPIPYGDTPAAWAAIADQVTARIESAVTFLSNRGIKKLVLLGHDFGANALVRYLGEQAPGSKSVVAGVLIGMPIKPVDRLGGTLGHLRKIRVPILDAYGAHDLPEVRHVAEERAFAARDARNQKYRQTAIPGADHQFTGADAVLLSRVRAWLHSAVTAPAASQ